MKTSDLSLRAKRSNLHLAEERLLPFDWAPFDSAQDRHDKRPCGPLNDKMPVYDIPVENGEKPRQTGFDNYGQLGYNMFVRLIS